MTREVICLFCSGAHIILFMLFGIFNQGCCYLGFRLLLTTFCLWIIGGLLVYAIQRFLVKFNYLFIYSFLVAILFASTSASGLAGFTRYIYMLLVYLVLQAFCLIASCIMVFTLSVMFFGYFGELFTIGFTPDAISIFLAYYLEEMVILTPMSFQCYLYYILHIEVDIFHHPFLVQLVMKYQNNLYDKRCLNRLSVSGLDGFTAGLVGSMLILIVISLWLKYKIIHIYPEQLLDNKSQNK